MTRQRIRTTVIAAAIASTLSGAAHAVRIDYTVDAGYERDDNVTLSEDAPIEQNIARLGVGFTLEQASSTVQASVVGRIDHRRYEDIYDDMTDRMLQGRVNWMIVPDRLGFVVEDSYGVQSINRFNPDSPDNRQQVNVLSLGPSLHFRAGQALQGLAELRYINSDAEITEDFNSDRLLAALRLTRDIDATSALSFNVQAQNIDFDNDLVARDHNRFEAFASYRRTYRMFDMLVDAGYAHLDYDDGGSRGSPLVRAELGWNPSERSRFSINAASQLSDAAIGTLDAIGESTGLPSSVMTGSTTVTASAYEQRSLGAQYTYTGTRTVLSIFGQAHELEYVDVDAANEESRSAGVSLRYRLRPTLVLGASASVDRNEYGSPVDRRETNHLYTLGLEKSWSRNWSSSLTYTRYERSTPTPLASFEQNVIYLSLAYRNR